jgi:hypothetical protein
MKQFLVVMLLLSGCSEKVENQFGVPVEVEALNKQRETAKEDVKALLRDPESAIFRNVVVWADSYTCGEVNSRNGFGGMAGYTRFISMGAQGTFIIGQDPTVEDVIKRSCVREGGFDESNKLL